MKNWTLRQRILASFAVIIAIMLLMVVLSYSRLLKIEVSENSVRDDAVPGVFFSSMIRSAWVDSYLQTQFNNFKQGKRGYQQQDKFGRQMKMMANTLNEQELQDVLAYLNTLAAN